MEVHIDCPNKLWEKNSQGRQKGGDVQGHQGVNPPFFELQTPDFAWKFKKKMAAISCQLLVKKCNKSKNAKRAKKITFAPAMSTLYLLMFI